MLKNETQPYRLQINQLTSTNFSYGISPKNIGGFQFALKQNYFKPTTSNNREIAVKPKPAISDYDCNRSPLKNSFGHISPEFACLDIDKKSKRKSSLEFCATDKIIKAGSGIFLTF